MRIHGLRLPVSAWVLVLVLAGTGCGKDSGDPTAAPQATVATTSAPATTATPASGVAYCADVRAALALKPGDGEITDATRKQHGAYAAAVGKLVMTAPGGQQGFWKATQTLAANIANGREADPSNAAAAQTAFASIDTVATQVMADCKIDITT